MKRSGFFSPGRPCCSFSSSLLEASGRKGILHPCDTHAQPPTVACKMEAQSEYVHVAHTFFCIFGADLHAQLVLINKISASELRRKSIKSALLVGQEVHRQKKSLRKRTCHIFEIIDAEKHNKFSLPPKKTTTTPKKLILTPCSCSAHSSTNISFLPILSTTLTRDFGYSIDSFCDFFPLSLPLLFFYLGNSAPPNEFA